MNVKVSDIVATVSARVRVCGVRWGRNNPKKEFVVRSMLDVINIVAINGNIFIQFICFASRLNLYDGQLFIYVQFHVHI